MPGQITAGGILAQLDVEEHPISPGRSSAGRPGDKLSLESVIAGIATPRLGETFVPIYDWFTEGFDTNDLKETKALLAALRW